MALSAHARPCCCCACSAISARRRWRSSGSRLPKNCSHPAMPESVASRRMPTVEGAGVELAYEESAADGPAVVLVHGMAADRTACTGWGLSPERARTGWGLSPERARVIAYDRRGYGASGAPEPYERTTVAEQAEDLVALLRAAAATPAVAAAADFGALVVLDVLHRHPGVL